MKEYLGIIMTVGSGAAAGTAMVLLSALFGPKRPTRVKGQPFECGMPPAQPARRAVSVNFYLTALIFVMFDVEVVFLYPWAVDFREAGAAGFAAMSGFILVLLAALVYSVKRGALEWD